MKKTLLVILIATLLMVPAYGNAVYYESNAVTTETIVEQPLEGKDCIYDVEVSWWNPYEGTVTIINHANRPAKGQLRVTITGGKHLGFCVCDCTYWWVLSTDVKYRGESIPFSGLSFSSTPPTVTHTFSPRVYQPGENTYPIRVNCVPQVVDICWEVV